jgi:hypothetical protein
MRTARRAALRALGVVAVTLPGAFHAARAQDPRATVVLNAARDWLQMTDRSDAAASHAAAGAKFRQALAVAEWSTALKAERAPRGALVQRTAQSTTFDPKIPKAPPGDYAILQFRTAFAQQSVAQETLTLEREADGKWRVIGYFVR